VSCRQAARAVRVSASRVSAGLPVGPGPVTRVLAVRVPVGRPECAVSRAAPVQVRWPRRPCRQPFRPVTPAPHAAHRFRSAGLGQSAARRFRPDLPHPQAAHRFRSAVLGQSVVPRFRPALPHPQSAHQSRSATPGQPAGRRFRPDLPHPHPAHPFRPAASIWQAAHLLHPAASIWQAAHLLRPATPAPHATHPAASIRHAAHPFHPHAPAPARSHTRNGAVQAVDGVCDCIRGCAGRLSSPPRQPPSRPLRQLPRRFARPRAAVGRE
jgi:hypothetical protein